MKIQTLAGAGSLLLSAVAHGDFVGVVVKEVGTYNDGATDWTTYHLYVEFDDSNDQVIAFIATPATGDLWIASTGDLGFYQDLTFGTDFEHNRLLDPVFPGVAYDSFLTHARNDTNEPGMPTNVSPNFDPEQLASFNAGGPLNVTDAGWARVLTDPLSHASYISTSPFDNEFRIMFAQLTIESSASFDPASHIIMHTIVNGQHERMTDIPVPPPCNGDLNGDNTVNADDFDAVLSNWGACAAPCPPACLGDANGDCTVNADDFLRVLSEWGTCE